jgi:hypothetical protein
MVQNRAAQGFHNVGDIASNLKAGDVGGALGSYANTLSMANPFSLTSHPRVPFAGGRGRLSDDPSDRRQNVASRLRAGPRPRLPPRRASRPRSSRPPPARSGARSTATPGRSAARSPRSSSSPARSRTSCCPASSMPAWPSRPTRRQRSAASSPEARAAAKVFRGVTEAELADEPPSSPPA